MMCNDCTSSEQRRSARETDVTLASAVYSFVRATRTICSITRVIAAMLDPEKIKKRGKLLFNIFIELIRTTNE